MNSTVQDDLHKSLHDSLFHVEQLELVWTVHYHISSM